MRFHGTWIRALRVFLEKDEDFSAFLQTLEEQPELKNEPVLVHAPNGVVQNFVEALRQQGVMAFPDRRTPSPSRKTSRERSPSSAPEPSSSLQVIFGHLRGGREVEAEGDVVVVGNVNPDAYVRAGGSIFVLGELYGVAYAGIPERRDAVVVALRMEPQQLGIADVLARSPHRVFPQRSARKKQATSTLEVAHYNAREGRIEITTLETFLRGGAA